MNLYTIGFAKKRAKDFFDILLKNNIAHVIDTRLNNNSQLAGFTKKDDLKYFLKKIGNIEYSHMLEWAPTADLLKNYREKIINWEEYKKQYLNILDQRNIKKSIDSLIVNNVCLLCSEEKPEHCHRYLLAEYIAAQNKNIKIINL